jgi:4-hydroxy-2-oxoheptanedioate aldolase
MNIVVHQGKPFITAWSTIPEPLLAEHYANSSADAVTFDMQHGLLGLESVMRCVTAVKRLGKPVVVRIALADWAAASRCLDFGADGIIAPMINTVEDAKALVDATKYPPMGGRSYGPNRAVQLNPSHDAVSYRKSANSETKTLAMIETATAVSNLDGIAGTEGIDALFVGPADLSFSLAGGSEIVPFGENSIQAIRDVATAAKDHGKLSAIYCYSAKDAINATAMGYDFIAIGNDAIYVADGLENLLRDARG